MIDADVFDRIISVGDSDRRIASYVYNHAATYHPLAITARNAPIFATIAIENYHQTAEAEEDLRLLQLATQRMADFDPDSTIGRDELMKKCGISDDDLENTSEVEFE